MLRVVENVCCQSLKVIRIDIIIIIIIIIIINISKLSLVA